MKTPDLPFRLEGTYLKTKRAIEINVERMIREDGLETVLFGTFTVGDWDEDLGFLQTWDHAEGSRRFNSLATNLLSTVFKRWVVVTERHKSGAIHFHLIGSLASGANVRGGFDHEAVKRKDYRSVKPKLRAIWRLMRQRLPAYGFGRCELKPIRKTGEAVACYVAKYVEKNLFNRLPDDRRKKLVRYGGFNRSHCRAADIAWRSDAAAKWRRNAAEIACIGGITHADVAHYVGPKWAWYFSAIMAGDRFGWDCYLASAMMRNIERVSRERNAGVKLCANKADVEAWALLAHEGGDYFDPVWMSRA